MKENSLKTLSNLDLEVEALDLRRDLIIKVINQLTKESDEPLHLCISSKYYDKFKIACCLVQELILSVYDDYKKFCDKVHKNINPLNIKKTEGVYSRKDNDLVYYD